MARRTGFLVKARFFVASARIGDFKPEEPTMTEPTMEGLTLGLIPIGWRFVRRSEEVFAWTRRNAEIYDYDGLRFIGPKGEPPLLPLTRGRLY